MTQPTRRHARRHVRHTTALTLAALLAVLATTGATASSATTPPDPETSTQPRTVVSATFTIGGGVSRTDAYNGCTMFPYTYTYEGTPDTNYWTFNISEATGNLPTVNPISGVGPTGTGTGTYEFCGYDMRYGTHPFRAIVNSTRWGGPNGSFLLEPTYYGPTTANVTYIKPHATLTLTMPRTTTPGTPVKALLRGTGHYGEPVAGAHANKPPAIIVQTKQPGTNKWVPLLGDRILTTNKNGEAKFTFRPKTTTQIRATLKGNGDYYKATTKTLTVRVR